MSVDDYYHGGKAGLNPGDLLIPSPPHVDDGCPICVARRDGRSLTVGEYRAWLAPFGGRSRSILDMLGNAPDAALIDPPSKHKAVYITTDHAYARWYAARSRGDLYVVQPIGDVIPSEEDSFPSFVVGSARIRSVIERDVRLDRRDRRALDRRWARADRRQQARSVRGATGMAVLS